MRNRNGLLLIVWLLLITISFSATGMVAGDSLDYKPARGIIGMSPFYLMVNGLRLDYDYSITRNHWIQIAPIMFYSESIDERNFYSGHNFERHIGGGGHLYHRYYPGPGFGKTPIYISYGLMYHYNQIEYSEVVGQTRFNRNTTMNKMGFDVIIGLTAIAGDVFMFDFYTGMGVRFSETTSNATEPQLYDDTWFSPGFSGNIMLLGLRIGLVY